MSCRPSLTIGVDIWKRVRRWLADGENLLFCALIAAHLVPIWSFRHFPTQDGAAHLDSANIIRRYHCAQETILRQYYMFNHIPVPNWSGHLIIAVLMCVVPALVAEKIFLSLYLLLLPVSVRYALNATRQDTRFLSVLAFPMLFNWTLHKGFYNFSISLPFFFFVVGYWLKHREQLGLPEALKLCFLIVLLYFCHLFSLVMAAIAIGVVTVCLVFADLNRQSPLWTSIKARAIRPFWAFLPAIVLGTVFFLRSGAPHAAARPATGLWSRLHHFKALVSFDEREMWCSTAVVWLFAIVLIYILVCRVAQRRVNRNDALLLVAGVYLAIYLTGYDGMWRNLRLNLRVSLFVFLGLLLWFGAQSYSKLMRRMIQGVAAAITLSWLGLHAVKYDEFNDYLSEYLSGMDLIEGNTTLLPLNFSSQEGTGPGADLPLRVKPLKHAAGYIAAAMNVVNLDNYEASSKASFPVLFRAELNPFVHIGIHGGLEAEPPRVDFLSYPERTGGRVDYVLVWGLRETQRGVPEAQSVLSQLENGYDLIYTSPRRGLMQLYRRKDWRR